MSQAAVDLPDGPRLSPSATSFDWLARPFELLDRCAAEHGDTFTLRFARYGTHVVVSHPDDVRAVMTGDRDVLYAGRGNAMLEPILGKHSLLVADGERHLTQRAMLQPAFRPDRVERYGAVVIDATRRWIAGWKSGETVSVQRTALDISREVILAIVLGVDAAARERMASLIERFMQIVGTNAAFDDPQLDPRVADRFRSARAALADGFQQQIEYRRSHPEGGDDLLGMLLAHGSLGDEEIRDQLITMVMAGHETTASSISWAMLALAQHPQALSTLEQELDETQDDARLAQAPYLQAVCMETLRLRPVIPVISRELQRPFQLRSHVLPAGVFITPCAYLAHRRPQSFVDPLQFRPERFIGKHYSPYVYFPFGGGSHRCLGMSFAMVEMQIVVGMLVRRFRLTATGSTRAIRRAVTIVPSGGAKMHIERRAAA